MVVLLFLSTFIIAFAVATIVVLIFRKPIHDILNRVVPADISHAWAKYLFFAMYVAGIGGGVRVWDMEKYLTIQDPYKEILQLTPGRWLLEIYQTIIGTLQSISIILMIFFVFALIAVVIVRVFESRAVKAV